MKTFGGLTILVNNAGVARGHLPERFPEADWDIVLDTNLKAAFLLSQCAYPALAADGGGKIINMGSGYSLVGSVRGIAYAASKGGVVQLTKSLASAWAKANIQVNCITPGWMDAELTAGGNANPVLVERILRLIPAGRIGKPDDVVGLAVLLASQASAYITGQSMAVDGGWFTADLLVDFTEYGAAP